MTILKIRSIKKSCRLFAVVAIGMTWLLQAYAYPSSSPSSTVVDACMNKVLGTARVVASPSECRQDEYFVTLNVQEQQAQAITQPVVNTPVRAEVTRPDLAALMPALTAHVGVFSQASGRSRKECQWILGGKYQGRLQDLAQAWCDAAKRFEANEQGCQVGGSPEAPTMTCVETLTVYPKDGDPKQYRSQKTFLLRRNPDGTWQIFGW
jgi:hypothetical protein